MSKLATILGPVGSRHRRMVACLLSFIVGTLIGTLIFHRPYFSMAITAVVIAGQYLYLAETRAAEIY